MLTEELKRLKAESGMTAQELSDKSGVPISTVNKILQGQTDSPSFRAVCDMVKAMGGSVDELVGIKERGGSQADLLEMILAPYRRAIEAKNKWILRLFIFDCVMVTAVLVMAFR